MGAETKQGHTPHTPGPWFCGWNYFSGCVNDGTHPGWTPPKTIPPGCCAFCGNPEGELVRAHGDGGRSMHLHRFKAEDWHDIYAADGTRITGNYDYEEGGVCSSEADARLISAAPELLEALKECVAICSDPIRVPLPNPEGYREKVECRPCGKCRDCRARAAIRKAEGEGV